MADQKGGIDHGLLPFLQKHQLPRAAFSVYTVALSYSISALHLPSYKKSFTGIAQRVVPTSCNTRDEVWQKHKAHQWADK